MPWRAGAKVDASAPDCGPSHPILIEEPSLAVLPAVVAPPLAAVVAVEAAVVAPPPAAVVAAAAAVVAAVPLELLSLPQAAATSSDALHTATPSRNLLRRPATALSSSPTTRTLVRTLMPFPLCSSVTSVDHCSGSQIAPRSASAATSAFPMPAQSAST